MSIGEIAQYARVKGLQLVGTGDFTHPQWLKEIQRDLTPEADTGLFKPKGNAASSVHFMLTTEVCTIFDYQGKSRKVHHVILTSSVENAIRINDALGKHGSLTIDGRPTLNMTAPELVEEVMQASDENMVFPAHVWTPWFSLFGAFSGFDSIDECYQDMTKHIHAVETGLSSDPPMNWRLSKLDRYTLLSNSDSHSFWPWRMGREANVFELERLSYHEITDAVCTKDPKRLRFTIETDPAYGKYHWTGHRNCKVSLPADEARKRGNLCPVCGRRLTEGVEQRVEELADRPAGFRDAQAPGFMRLLPLSEIICAVLDVDSPSTQAVWKVYNALVDKFGDEYRVLIDASKEEMSQVVEQRFANAVVRVREGSITVVPGYDGVYGKLVLGNEAHAPPPLKQLKPPRRSAQQMNLADFW
ncbi:MAG: endonuclease Q family protein [Candidatus Bathyarchaeia archaeon]